MSNATVASRMHETGGVYAKGGRSFSSATITERYGVGARLSVALEVHQVGGEQPYISATAEAKLPRALDSVACGCLHEDILREWPEAVAVVRCHLSDARTGEPMHALANATYWAAGARGGWGERYHGSNAPTGHTPADCLRILAEHLRVTEAEAATLCERAENACPEEWREEYGKRVRERALAEAIDAMRPRWAKEAAEAVAFILAHSTADTRREYEDRIAAMRARPEEARP